MPFFCCVFVDKSGHTAFPADITADNLETAKRMRLSYLKTPHRAASRHPMPRPRAMGAEVWPLQSYRFRCGAGASG
jgi:hypothetical protein